jgi:hypothetical protein
MCKSRASLRLSTMARYLAALLLLLACNQSGVKTDVQQGTLTLPSAPDSIVLERSMCYGTCPAYRLRLSDAGVIQFESRNPGDEGRTATDTVLAATLPSLVARARSIGFFELPGDIASDSVLCHNRATDHPTAIVTVFTSSESKRVEDYHGCFETVEHDVLSPIARLRSFENEIDSVLRSSRWVRPASRR